MLIYRSVLSGSGSFAALFMAAVTACAAPCSAAETEIPPNEQSWIGISAFGIQSRNFQGSSCDNLIEALMTSPKPALAVLYKTFGNNNSCLFKYWETARSLNLPHLTEIHLSNEAGRRAGTTDKADFLYNLDVDRYNALLEAMPNWLRDDLIQRVREIVSLVDTYGSGGEFILSTGLEDNYTGRAFQNLYQIVAEEWPYLIARNVAFTKSMRRQDWVVPDNIILEFHGYNSKIQTQAPCIANGDGQDMNFLLNSGIDFPDKPAAGRSQVMRWLARATEKNCVIFFWAGKWQGFFSSSTPPRPLMRKFRFDREDIKPLSELLNGKIPSPAKRRKQRRKRK